METASLLRQEFVQAGSAAGAAAPACRLEEPMNFAVNG